MLADLRRERTLQQENEFLSSSQHQELVCVMEGERAGRAELMLAAQEEQERVRRALQVGGGGTGIHLPGLQLVGMRVDGVCTPGILLLLSCVLGDLSDPDVGLRQEKVNPCNPSHTSVNPCKERFCRHMQEFMNRLTISERSSLGRFAGRPALVD